MDITTSSNSQAISSSSQTVNPHIETNPSASTLSTFESRPVRTSARVRAAKDKSKDKGKAKERDSTTPDQQPSSSALTLTHTGGTETASASTRSKRTRETNTVKGKEQEVQEDPPRPTRRTRRSSPSRTRPLSINEPIPDRKGKKRAVPDPSSDEEEPSAKRQRTTAYSLRSQSKATTSDMPKKSRSSNAKGKMAAKGKAAASSSRLTDDDVEMLDSSYKHDISEPESPIDEPMNDGTRDNDVSEDEENNDDKPVEGLAGNDEADKAEGNEATNPPPPNDEPPPPAAMDEAAALSIFGDYRQFGSYMLSLSSRLKTILNNIKPTADATTRLVTLQELSELLSISTEDTLAGSFQVEQFVRELVKILGGRGVNEDEDDDGDDDGGEQDEDAALAAALALSAGGAYAGDENLEAQVLACRCLANLMEALPGVAHTVVYHGAIPVLCSKLIEISYIDLAEQTLSTMEKISEEFPSAIVREGGLAALLNYLDFFSIAVQRTALQAASNCCRNISSEHFAMILGVWPIIRNCLTYSDQRLVEFACMCVIRVIDSYHRSSAENLESLVDADLVRAVNMLLLPAGGSPLVASNTYTLLLRALATASRASPKIAVALLEADFVDTLYQILTGVLPSAAVADEQGDASGGQGLGGGLADMTVMENLSHRPKDQIEEALSLISELMPPLPKDGVFDHKAYTEKALAKMIKAKAKAERAAARQAAQAPLIAACLIAPEPASTSDINMADTPQEPEEPTATPAATRTELLRSKPAVVDRFMQLIVPILIDVYAASVNTPVRIKTMTGLLKAVSFLEPDGLQRVLTHVPVASFASSILSSRDHATLVIGALQLVDLLLAKVPSLYKPTFRREGVFHELDSLGARVLASVKLKEKEKLEKESSEPLSDTSSAAAPPLQPMKKLSSVSLDPDDAITLRARVINFKFLSSDDKAEGDNVFESLRNVVGRISKQEASEKEISAALQEFATLFSSPSTSVSSFELLQSGAVDELLTLTTDNARSVTLSKRKEILLDALVNRKTKVLPNTPTSFSTLVKKLQESLTKMESFDVVTIAQGSDDSKRSSPSLLARQLRLRLVAEDDSGVPRNLHNIVVSIHAIATFQALHDYLRPRVAGLLTGGSRVSSMLSALAAASGFAVASSSAKTEPPKPLPAASTSDAPEASGSATITRRRSQRLSAKKASDVSGDAADESSSSEQPTAPAATSQPNIASNETIVDADGAQADYTDDEVDAEVFDDEDDPDTSMADKTVTLSVAEDGSKVEAQTPDGTRVATPNILKETTTASALRNLGSAAVHGSYAAALKAKPTDWHLEFSMDEQALPLDLTIYGAIHQHEMRKKAGVVPSASLIWQGVYTIKFKKVTGPMSTLDSRSEGADTSKSRSSSPPLSSLPEDASHAKILRLLRVLHQLNTIESERAVFHGDRRSVAESAFVNNKLSAKLTRQLEEPMIVASSCLPDWALDLPQHFPFLFPFATRYNFLQSTSFGYARLILKWQSQQSRVQENSRRDDSIGFLGRLQRQKVRISRKHILESAVKVFELYGSSSSVLEVEYFEEVGTGLGPTLEFYSLVSKEFARKDLKAWRDSHHGDPGVYVHHPNGLYPAPISPNDITADGGQKRTHIFRVIGQFVAKAMLDSRIIDMSFNKIFLKLVLGEDVPLTIATLKLVDVDLANSLVKVQNIARGIAPAASDKVARKTALLESVTIEDLSLDFTIPGYDIELRPGGRDIAVTEENVEEYITDVLAAILGKGAALQAKAFREGFSKVFPITDLQAFSADELVMLFGNGDEDWSNETLSEAVKADHGFHAESKAIRDLVEIMSDFDAPTRRSYLQFITGSPKLPIGGFRGLNPPLTVVRKPHEAPLTADDYLPSVMTCVNYLKLPEYSSKAVMKEKLQTAMKEGVGSFHLS